GHAVEPGVPAPLLRAPDLAEPPRAAPGIWGQLRMGLHQLRRGPPADLRDPRTLPESHRRACRTPAPGCRVAGPDAGGRAEPPRAGLRLPRLCPSLDGVHLTRAPGGRRLEKVAAGSSRRAAGGDSGCVA